MKRKDTEVMGSGAKTCRLALAVTFAVLCCCLLLAGGLYPARAQEQELDANYEQARRQYYLRRAEMLAEKGPYHTWPLEDKAALDDIMYQAGYWDIHHIVPGEADVSEAEAIAMGREAILQGHDIVSGKELDAFAVYTDFYLLGGPDAEEVQHLWVLQYETPAGAEEIGTFRVEIDSPSGEVELCLWYPGEYSGRQEELQSLQQEFSNVPPVGATVSEAEAVRIARRAVLRQYGVGDGLTETILHGFWANAWLREDQNLWQVEFQSPDAEIQGEFGGYIVYVSPKTGEVHGVEHGGNG